MKKYQKILIIISAVLSFTYILIALLFFLFPSKLAPSLYHPLTKEEQLLKEEKEDQERNQLFPARVLPTIPPQ